MKFIWTAWASRDYERINKKVRKEEWKHNESLAASLEFSNVGSRFHPVGFLWPMKIKHSKTVEGIFNKVPIKSLRWVD